MSHTPFTLHFATINTSVNKSNGISCFIFTLHFATINTVNKHFQEFLLDHLHYTLLLLILYKRCEYL